jgi:hypothetical protein
MAAKHNMVKKSPFAKLFSSDEQADKQLQKIRDRIYYFAWSRNRRDEAKLDWVLSENGIDRNVYLKRLGQASAAQSRDHTDALPCWLLLANKRISADFTRYIYSINDLDILVDLKSNDTGLNRSRLDKIVNLLQGVNFQRYTRSARVRIHFPDKYTFQDLPVFNQYVLENIALALDRFQQLSYFSVRVVPMQGPELYELRLATFPFYPMSMTNWSIRILNSKTYNWDVVGGEQLHQLNLAWDLFQETGSLTAIVHAPGDAEKTKATTNQIPQAKGAADMTNNMESGPKKNGSQKRKGRKLRVLPTAAAPCTTDVTSTMPSADLAVSSSSPPLDTSKHPRSIQTSVHNSGSATVPSATKSSTIELPVRSAEKPPDTVSLTCEAAETAHHSSLPSSSRKLETTSVLKQGPASEVSYEASQTEHTAGQQPGPPSSIETAPEESMNHQRHQAAPSSSAQSSVTLGRDQRDDEIEAHAAVEESPRVETTIKEAGADAKKPARKKRKNRKKGKKRQLTDTAENQSNEAHGKQVPVQIDGHHAVLITLDKADQISASEGQLDGQFDGFIQNGHRKFPLSEITELIPLESSDQLWKYKRSNGNHGIIYRSADLDRLSRQLERKAVQEKENEAEKMKAKEKKKNKKAKEIRLRRKELVFGLRRRLEDTKQLPASKLESDLKKRINELVGEGFERAGLGFQEKDSEDEYSSDSCLLPTPSSPEEAFSSPLHSGYRGMSPVSHHREPSSPSRATISEPPRSTQVFDVPYNFGGRDKVSPLEKRNRQMNKNLLGEEIEDSDDSASVVSQYGDDGPPSISDHGGQGSTA